MEDEVVKFPVCFKLYERRGFYILLFYLFSLCECMWHAHVCVWCGYGAKRRLVGVLLYHSRHYYLETGFLTEPGARLVASKPHQSPVSVHYDIVVTGVYVTISRF